MVDRDAWEDVTLLDVLIDGFEKNEMLDGCHWRNVPMPDEAAAARKFTALVEEARRWQGAPTRERSSAGRQLVAWPDLEILQAGRGILVRVRAPQFSRWWDEPSTWRGDPLGAVYDWSEDDRHRR